MAQRGMKFGIFLAPFHRLGENPTLAMARDMELIEWLDWLGYDEAWIGEHHSAGWEVIASPELFIAEAACRTRTIRLGSGVTSLPSAPCPTNTATARSARRMSIRRPNSSGCGSGLAQPAPGPYRGKKSAGVAKLVDATDLREA